MIKEISDYFGPKLLEWVTSATLVSLGLEIMIWPSTLGFGSFHYMVNYLPGGCLGIMFFLIGGIRLVALIVNGRSWEYGPKARAVGAIVGALIWAQMDVALWLKLPDVLMPSPGIPIWFWFTLAELLTAYRAATDVRIRPIVGSPNN